MNVKKGKQSTEDSRCQWIAGKVFAGGVKRDFQLDIRKYLGNDMRKRRI